MDTTPLRDLFEIEKRLVVLFEPLLGRPVRAADTWAELGVDSLQLAELMCDVERSFDVRIDDRVLEVESVSGLALCLYRQKWEN